MIEPPPLDETDLSFANSYIGCTVLLAGALVGTFANGEGMLMAGRALVGASSFLLLVEPC